MKQLRTFYLDLRSFYKKRKELITNSLLLFIFCIGGFLGLFFCLPKSHTYTEEEKIYAYELAQSVWIPKLYSLECNNFFLTVKFDNATVTQSNTLVTVTLKDKYSTSYKNYIAFDFYNSNLFIEGDNFEAFSYIFTIVSGFVAYGACVLLVICAVSLIIFLVLRVLKHALKFLSRPFK